VGRYTLGNVPFAGGLDASHLRAFQTIKTVVVVVCEAGNQMSVCTHIHIVRCRGVMLKLRSQDIAGGMTMVGEDRSREVERTELVE
jgi:hypothetical protein